MQRHTLLPWGCVTHINNMVNSSAKQNWAKDTRNAHMQMEKFINIQFKAKLNWTARDRYLDVYCAQSLQSRLSLCDLMDCSPSGSSVHGLFQARILVWVATPSSRGSSQARDRTRIAGGFLPTKPPGKPTYLDSRLQRKARGWGYPSQDVVSAGAKQVIQKGLSQGAPATGRATMWWLLLRLHWKCVVFHNKELAKLKYIYIWYIYTDLDIYTHFIYMYPIFACEYKYCIWFFKSLSFDFNT